MNHHIAIPIVLLIVLAGCTHINVDEPTAVASTNHRLYLVNEAGTRHIFINPGALRSVLHLRGYKVLTITVQATLTYHPDGETLTVTRRGKVIGRLNYLTGDTLDTISIQIPRKRTIDVDYMRARKYWLVLLGDELRENAPDLSEDSSKPLF